MSSLFQTYSRWPIDIKKAKGTIAEDENGKTYLDFIQASPFPISAIVMMRSQKR